MENIGSYLLEKRKERGLSLEEVSSITKLHPNILKTIEKNELHKLGGFGYTKILISTYARALGLSQQEIDKLLVQIPKGETGTPRQSKEILHPPTILIHKNIFLIILLLLLIAVLTYAVVKLYQDERIPFPLRPAPVEEEYIEPLSPEDLHFDDEESDANQGNSFEEEVSLSLSAVSDEFDIENHEDTAHPIVRENFTKDRTDYLLEYAVLTKNLTFPREDRYFSRYIGTF